MNKKSNQIANRFVRLHGLLVRQWMAVHQHGEISPHKGQGRVLAVLKMQPEIGQKELGYLLDMSKQALAELLSKLEKNEYIIRTQSEKDRRSFIVKLTDKGREAMPEDDEAGEIGIEGFFDCLSDDEQSGLLNYLERIIDEIEKQSETDEDDYAEFFRQRFFARHGGHRHHGFHGGFRGFGSRGGFFGFGGKKDDDDE